MKTILLLDDEPVVMMLLRIMLKHYRLIEASTAEQALQLFTDRGRQLDLLLADLTLPKISGIQVALVFRSEIPNLPVILMSGFPLSSWTDREYTDLERLGSNSVTILQKPFTPRALSNAVCELIGVPPPELARTA